MKDQPTEQPDQFLTIREGDILTFDVLTWEDLE